MSSLLSPTSAAMYERNASWLRARESRHASVVAALLDKEAALLQRSPKISERSARLAAESGRSGGDIVARLFSEAERIRAHKSALAAEVHAASFVGVPAITRAAAELHRDGPVSERLFAHAASLKKKKEELVSTLIRQEREAAAPPPPPPRARAPGLAGGDAPKSTTDALFAAAHERAKKAAERRLKADKEAREAAHPALNKHSLEIAAAIPRDKLAKLYHKTLDAGGAPAADGAPSPAAAGAAGDAAKPRPSFDSLPPDATFAPKITQRSTAIAARRNATAPSRVEERLLLAVAAKEAKLKEISRSVAESELAACTFQPNTAGGGGGGAGGGGGGGGSPPRAKPPPAGPAAVALMTRRALAWAAERDAKLESARKAAAQRELVGCTFAPNAGARARRASVAGPARGASGTELLVALAAHGGPRAGGAAATASRAAGRRASLPGRMPAPPARGVAAVVPGVATFAARLSKGRALAEEIKNPSWVPDGSKWTGRTTTGVAPALLTSGGARAGSPSARSVRSSVGGGGAGGPPARARAHAAVHVRGGAGAGAGALAGAPSAEGAASFARVGDAAAALAAVAPPPAGPARALPLSALAPPPPPARRTPEEIIQETIARSLGRLAAAPGVDAAGGGGGGGGGFMSDAPSASDVLARLSAIRYSAAGGAPAAGARPSGAALGTQLRATLLSTGAPAGGAAGAGGGGAAPGAAAAAAPASAFSRVGGGTAGGVRSLGDVLGRAEPPAVRFAMPAAPPPAPPAGGGGAGGGGGEAAEAAMLARVDAMAAAAAARAGKQA